MRFPMRTVFAAAALTAIAATSMVVVAAERHPAIRNAIGALDKAKYDLQHANHDFGGHRVEALQAVDQAIAQLKIALQYDKN